VTLTPMEPIGEWCFEFVVFSSCSNDRHSRLADKLHMAAVEWSERQDLGVGGGFRVEATMTGSCSIHRFGLTATRDNQFISNQQAQAFFEFLRSYSKKLGAELNGGYHLFGEEE
jgi:hypothetical protein